MYIHIYEILRLAMLFLEPILKNGKNKNSNNSKNSKDNNSYRNNNLLKID